MCYEISNRLLVKFDQHLYCCADKDYGLITVVEISLFTSVQIEKGRERLFEFVPS